jgi:hypothetical protein
MAENSKILAAMFLIGLVATMVIVSFVLIQPQSSGSVAGGGTQCPAGQYAYEVVNNQTGFASVICSAVTYSGISQLPNNILTNLGLYYPVTLGGVSTTTTPDLSTFGNTGTLLNGTVSSVVQTNSCFGTANVNSINCSFSKSVASGDILVAFVGAVSYSQLVTGSFSVSDSACSSWTAVDTAGGGSASGASFYCTAGSGGSDTVSLSNSGNSGIEVNLGIAELSGLTTSGLTHSAGSSAGSVGCCSVISFSLNTFTLAGYIVFDSSSATHTTGFNYFTASPSGDNGQFTGEYSTSTSGTGTIPAASCTGAFCTYWAMTALSFAIGPANANTYYITSPCGDLSGQCIYVGGLTANSTGIKSAASNILPNYYKSIQQTFTMAGFFEFTTLPAAGHYSTLISWGGTTSNSGISLLVDSSGHLDVVSSSGGTVKTETSITLAVLTVYWLGGYYPSSVGTTFSVFAFNLSGGAPPIVEQTGSITLAAALTLSQGTILYICNPSTSGYSGCITGTTLQDIRVWSFALSAAQTVEQMQWYYNTYQAGI